MATSPPRRTSADSSSGEDPAQRAKDICLRLLTARPRTRTELHQALLRKAIPEDTAHQVLSRLDEVGLIDDASFAALWVHSRHTHQGLGRRALSAELRRKGIPDHIAANALATVDPDAEEERARQLVRKRLRTLPPTTDDATRVRKLITMLARRGYPEALAFHVVRDELRTTNHDIGLLDDTP